MARRRQNVSIDTKQVKGLQANINKSQTNMEKNITRAANEVLTNTEADAKNLAPRDKGDLENSIRASKAVYSRGNVSGTVGSNLVYALRRHEEKPRMGTYNKYENGVKYVDYYINGRGEMTRAKQEVHGHQPGRKYLTNASLINEENWTNNIKDAIADSYKGL